MGFTRQKILGVTRHVATQEPDVGDETMDPENASWEWDWNEEGWSDEDWDGQTCHCTKMKSQGL